MIFSIVICTYNPNELLLEKVVDSVVNQNFPSEEFEIIIVDNNSKTNVSALSFIKHNDSLCVKTELKQGLAFARITAVKAARSEHIVFVDDDNVLNADYLENLKKLVAKYKDVAVWGPGRVTVNYIDGAPDWIRKHFSSLFQEKDKTITQYGCVAAWPDYYPSGSGMAVRKNVFETYIEQFEAGILSATGRKGNSLASAEDSQIVWTAVKMGLAAGTSPSLKLDHLIPKNRLNRKYLSDLSFGIGKSYKAALLETFPELKNSFKNPTLMNKLNFILKMLYKSKGNPLMFHRFYTIENGWIKGSKN